MSDSNQMMPYEDYKALAKDMFASGFFQHIKNPQQALVTIIAGHEFGMGPFEAMNSIYIIQGRPAFYANKYADMVMRSGKYRYEVLDHTNERCEIQFFRLGLDGRTWEKAGKPSVFTMEDAKTAELDKRNPNWRLYPKNMLFARALSNGARWNCPDAFQGAYTVEEMGAIVEYEKDELNSTETIVELPDQSVPKEIKDSKDDSWTSESVASDKQIDSRKEGNKWVTEAVTLTVGNFVEKQTANGDAMGEITFLEAVSVKNVTVRWPEFLVSFWIFAEKPDMYRALKEGDKVLAKLSFEEVKGKNYQNCTIITVLEEEVDKFVVEVEEEPKTEDKDEQQEDLL